jgi:hypothetical protein
MRRGLGGIHSAGPLRGLSRQRPSFPSLVREAVFGTGHSGLTANRFIPVEIVHPHHVVLGIDKERRESFLRHVDVEFNNALHWVCLLPCLSRDETRRFGSEESARARTWMNPPIVYEETYPSNQKIIKITAIVSSIFISPYTVSQRII